MNHFAAMPSWLLFIILMSVIGPAMRFTFGSRSRRLGGSWDRTGRVGRQDLERLEAAVGERDAVIEDLQHRLSEMESRLDFTERLIAQKSDVNTPA